MTKKLEELFNLPQDDEEVVAADAVVEPITISLQEKLEEFDKISSALPRVKGLGDISDSELDALANKAEKAYDDLMDLGMNVEVRYSSRIFEVASSMLGHAITAKTNKVEKKLKAIDLQLKKYKIDKDNNEDPNDVINGAGYVVLDRNEMIKKLGGKA